MSSILEIYNLSKMYNNNTVLDNINLLIQANEIVGLVGDNGSGKTTLLKSILKLTDISNGEVYINNINYQEQLAFSYVGSLIETPTLYRYMTGYENLKCQSILYPNIESDRIEELIKILDLQDFIFKEVNQYSLGMKQRLAIALSLLNKPSLLLLDEPMNGLDPKSNRALKNYLKSIKSKTSIIISSHILSDLEFLCDRVFLLDNGKINEICLDSQECNIVVFELDSADKAIEVLRTINIQADKVEIDKISSVLDKKQIAKSIKLINLQGIEIYSVTKQKRSLEEEYYKIAKDV